MSSRDTKIGMILQSYGEELSPCSYWHEVEELNFDSNKQKFITCIVEQCRKTSNRCKVDCKGYKQFCNLDKQSLTKDKLEEILENFATRIKDSFYYGFEELIPSIVSDKIDQIKQEVLNEVYNPKR